MSIDGPYETELKLAAHDAQVLEAVAGLRTLAGYVLRPHPEHQIRDQYWDTPQGVLSARRLSLRLRSQDGAPIFTVKRAATVDDGLFRRRETELSASRQTWAQIRAELAAEGARLRDAPAQGSEASDWLRAAGLVVTQERCTERRILIAERNDRPLAEIALDSTTYHVDVYDVVFREIEIESLTDEAEHVLSLGGELRRAFAGRLSPSQQGKYSRGLELAARFGTLGTGAD